MNIAVLLMGGSGSRIDSKIPKQFLKVNNKKIYQYCLDKFISNKNIDSIILVCNSQYINDIQKEIDKQHKQKNIFIVEGGETRTHSLKKALKFINDQEWDGYIISHDVARPLVSKELINEHISLINKNNDSIINTFLESTDTLSVNQANKNIIIDRTQIIRHQTPQSISIKNLNLAFKTLTKNQWIDKTDLVDICDNLDLNIINVKGDPSNFKITNKFDLDLFKFIVSKK